ncbi:MAG: thioredoxin domain-containing protein [Proteobacteria bacterium]|nr:thioredoxin domain-containing protein [Pseudomonadota bacterium]
MMMRLALVALAVMTAVSVHAAPMDKAAVEKIVADYIASHGDAVLASVTKAQDKAARDQAGKLISAHTPVMGPASAQVTIVEFGEFQCPYCGRVQPTIDQLRKEYGNKVRWAFKNLPLSFHPMATPAAYAAMAAQQQGKFWPYAHALWADQKDLSEALLVKTAKAVGLDMAKFEADRKSAKIKAMVEADMADAERIGAQGTPFFVINGKAVSGALPAESFKKVIDGELAGGK